MVTKSKCVEAICQLDFKVVFDTRVPTKWLFFGNFNGVDFSTGCFKVTEPNVGYVK
ncbi:MULTISPECIES: hypothetical protein [unclassified Imperialibacter]|uniref:hypothetical protein n=1 Tax=unclassified Imperialibacter TaxID=2629706 RepID=UPI00186A2E18|nr:MULTISPECIES: hypothetical protein [unclassified Imperialibacter]